MSLVAHGAGRNDIWWHDFQQAKAEAQRIGRPMLVHFHASWCGPCEKMEKEIFSDREVQEFLASNFIPVKVDCSTPNPLADEFNIELLPADLVVSPDGQSLSKTKGFPGTGKVGRRAYLDQLNLALAQNQPKPAAEPAKPVQDELKQPPEQKADLKLIVGLERYSPVALVKQRKWIKGKPEHAWQYQGVVYLMRDAEEVREFQAEPAKFAPKLLGCDPVVLWTSDKAVVGSTQFGAIFDESLYLFSSAETRDRFKKEPALFTRPQHVLKVNDVDGPRWR